MSGDLPTAEEAELADWFEGWSEFSIETACARVFLAGDTAFKVKRRVDRGYLDFSTPEQRQWAIERELEFNSVTAPDIYRCIRKVTREADGGLALDGDGEVVELALEMRRFPDEVVLAADPAMLDDDMAEALGRAIAGFHAEAPLKPQGGFAALSFTIDSNAKLLREMAGRLGEALVEELVTLTDAARAKHRDLLMARTAAGFARRCHGDLHLGNILVENGRPVLFDCIEFNDLISDIDVQYDLAFLLMDLSHRGRDETAVRVLSAYLDQASRCFPAEKVRGGLATLPLHLAVRAGVRAHVSAHSGDDEAAKNYLRAGIAHLSPPPARLVAVGGLSGAGKSSVARKIAPGVGASPGAVVLRSDETRKRLWKAEPAQTLPPAAYEPSATEAVFDEMFTAAGQMLEAGRAVVLDATFMDAALRLRAAQLAADHGVAFDGLWLEAPAAVLEARIAGRAGDASDATVTTLKAQLRKPLGDLTWTRIDASRAPGQAARAALGHLRG